MNIATEGFSYLDLNYIHHFSSLLFKVILRPNMKITCLISYAFGLFIAKCPLPHFDQVSNKKLLKLKFVTRNVLFLYTPTPNLIDLSVIPSNFMFL